MAQAHDGSLGAAHAYIDAAADAGVDAVKFQTHFAGGESTLEEPFRVRFSRQDKDRWSYWRRMEFSHSQWRDLADHCTERGVAFLSSAFSEEAIELLEGLQMPVWKIASGEVGNLSFLHRIASIGRPLLLSTGLSDWHEIDHALAEIRSIKPEIPIAILQCTSSYPTPLELVGLNVLEELRVKYHCPVGLSDHSGNPSVAIAALARGASILEVHLAFHPKQFGPDTSASLTPEELNRVCLFRDEILVMDRNPVDKDVVARDLLDVKSLFARSVALRTDLPAGHVLTTGDLILKKPGGGFTEAQLQFLVGRALAVAVSADRLLRPDDLSGGWPPDGA
ncbi:N-acetylneuraminate synthase family protein [bacterium]|nr:N-acetylneuraminate synthase family protein [bacterium]